MNMPFDANYDGLSNDTEAHTNEIPLQSAVSPKPNKLMSKDAISAQLAPHGPLIDETLVNNPLVQDQASAFLTDLKTLEASLSIGKALFDIGDADGALRHFEGVTATLKGPLGRRLMTNGFALDHVIKDADVLPHAVRHQDSPVGVDAAWSHVFADIGDHALLIDASDRHAPAIVLDVVSNLLTAAAHLYSEAEKAVDDDGIDIEAYQTARGLIWTARDLVGSQSSALASKNQKTAETLMRELGRLQGVWARMTPDHTSPSALQVCEHITRIQGLLAAF